MPAITARWPSLFTECTMFCGPPQSMTDHPSCALQRQSPHQGQYSILDERNQLTKQIRSERMILSQQTLNRVIWSQHPQPDEIIHTYTVTLYTSASNKWFMLGRPKLTSITIRKNKDCVGGKWKYNVVNLKAVQEVKIKIKQIELLRW